MAADGGDVVAVVDYITIGNVSRWPSVLSVQEEKNGRRFSRPHTERVGSRESHSKKECVILTLKSVLNLCLQF